MTVIKRKDYQNILLIIYVLSNEQEEETVTTDNSEGIIIAERILPN
jgi:hypothetical protein